MRLLLGREPHRLEVPHPVIIEELLSLAAKASQSKLAVGLRMLKAYNEGTPVFEEAR